MTRGLAALFGWHLRRRVRDRGTPPFLVLTGLGLVAILAWPAGPGRGELVAQAVLVLAALAAALVAAGAGGALPLDRVTGNARFVASLAASAPVRRAAPALAGALAAILVGGLVAAVGAAAAAAVGAGLSTRETTSLSVLAREGGTDRFPPLEVAAPPAGAEVELDVAPLFRVADAAGRGTTRLEVASAHGTSVHEVPVRGSVRLGRHAGPITLRDAEAEVHVRVLAARAIGGPASFLLALGGAGLLLALGLAVGAPLAVLLSRVLSGPTAFAASALLLLVGLTRSSLLTVAADADSVAGGALAAAVLRGAVWLAPDLSALGVASEAALGRTVPAAAWGALASPFAYGLLCLGLGAFLPGREPAS